MLLIVAIVQGEDAPRLGTRLVEQGLRLTRISSGGGILGPGNMAFLLGIEDHQEDVVLKAIHATCRKRNKYINIAEVPEPLYFGALPMEVEVGGAVVFGVPIERFAHIEGSVDTAHEAADRATDREPIEATDTPDLGSATAQLNDKAGEAMKLMVAIVQADDADNVIGALVTAGHRLTRINTTGGFLRRGNATLLIGVQEDQVDEILAIMQTSCSRRDEANPIEKGMPKYAANVFVLDATHFVRM